MLAHIDLDPLFGLQSPRAARRPPHRLTRDWSSNCTLVTNEQPATVAHSARCVCGWCQHQLCGYRNFAETNSHRPLRAHWYYRAQLETDGRIRPVARSWRVCVSIMQQRSMTSTPLENWNVATKKSCFRDGCQSTDECISQSHESWWLYCRWIIYVYWVHVFACIVLLLARAHLPWWCVSRWWLWISM